jgi:nucleoside-diphosphate-sugar epimerase
MKTVLVTGASGLLGRSVVKHLLKGGFHVISSIMPIEQSSYAPNQDEQVVLNDDVFAGNLPHIDVVVNCAFARSNNAEQLASAFDFTTQLIQGFRKADIDGIINISSQGVYKRLPVGQLSREDSPIEPIDTYSMSKYAAEKMFVLSGIKYVTSVRLASLNMKQRFLYHFVRSAKEEGVIHLDSPRVYASILDVEDAAAALTALAAVPASQWKSAYNLSIGAQYSLEEYARTVKTVGEKLGYKIEIVVNDNGKESTAGSDISQLTADTGWKPTVANEQIIQNLFSEC